MWDLTAVKLDIMPCLTAGGARSGSLSKEMRERDWNPKSDHAVDGAACEVVPMVQGAIITLYGSVLSP